jgi:hypothetical protein
MGLKLLSPRYSVVLNKIFDDERVGVLKDFLMAVLDLPADEYQDIILIEERVPPMSKDDKLGYLNLRIVTKSGAPFQVELQISPKLSRSQFQEYCRERFIADSKRFADDHDKINRDAIIIISYSIFIEEFQEVHHHLAWFEGDAKQKAPFSSSVHLLQVPRVKDGDDSPVANWLRFFAAETEAEYAKAAQTRPAIAEAWKVVQQLSADKKARRLSQ